MALKESIDKLAQWLREQRIKSLQRQEKKLKIIALQKEREKPYLESINKSKKRIQKAQPRNNNQTKETKDPKDYYKVDLGMDDFKLWIQAQ